MATLPETTALDLERDAGWLTVWFNEPDIRNPLSDARVKALLAMCEAIRNDRTVRGVTFRGRGGIFCAGGDLKLFKSAFEGKLDRDAIIAMSLEAGTLFDAINTLPQLTVMAIEGAAMAGGLGLACAGDLVVAEQSAKFAFSETTIGLTPAQISPFVLQRVGLREGRRLMLLAESLSADQAMEIGLVDRICAGTADLDAAIMAVQKQLTRCAPGAVADTKALILAIPQLSRAEQMRLAAENFADRFASEEARDGIAGFFEKRKPRWAEE
ncbi:MAG: enoyl-CoA hydratase-related protein [Pseudomonadota bacterium]